MFHLDYVGKQFVWKGLLKRTSMSGGASSASAGSSGSGSGSEKSGGSNNTSIVKEGEKSQGNGSGKKRSSLGLEIRDVLGKALTSKWYGLFPATEIIRIGGNDMVCGDFVYLTCFPSSR